MISREVLSAMKPTAFLVNLARGAHVVEASSLDLAAIGAANRHPLALDHPADLSQPLAESLDCGGGLLDVVQAVA